MESDIRHLIVYIEKCFYNDYRFSSESKELCSAKKQLPCNCLTGIIINYWAFAYNNCIRSFLDFSFGIYQNKIAYVICSYNNKILIPILPDESKDYLLNNDICRDDKVSTEQVYIRRSYDSFDKDLDIDLENISSQKKNSESLPILYILAYYYPVTRICSLEKESFLLLFMTIYMFPNRTMKRVFEYYSSSATKKEKEYIISFLNKYESFLATLNSEEYGFFTRFSCNFEKYTKVSIDEWIEKFNKHMNPEFFLQTLIAAYNRNIEEQKRRSSYFRKIKELNKTEMDNLDGITPPVHS